MTDITITKEDGPERGRFVAHMDGRAAEAGEVTYVKVSDGVISANHTGVPKDLRGHGMAGKLVKAMADDARAEGYKIIPRCPYIPVWLKRNPSYADVFTDAA